MSHHGKGSKRIGLPKGAYRLPNGNYVTESVGPPDKDGRRLKFVALHRAQPDVHLLSRALMHVAKQHEHDSDDVDSTSKAA